MHVLHLDQTNVNIEILRKNTCILEIHITLNLQETKILQLFNWQITCFTDIKENHQFLLLTFMAGTK